MGNPISLDGCGPCVYGEARTYTEISVPLHSTCSRNPGPHRPEESLGAVITGFGEQERRVRALEDVAIVLVLLHVRDSAPGCGGPGAPPTSSCTPTSSSHSRTRPVFPRGVCFERRLSSDEISHGWIHGKQTKQTSPTPTPTARATSQPTSNTIWKPSARTTAIRTEQPTRSQRHWRRIAGRVCTQYRWKWARSSFVIVKLADACTSTVGSPVFLAAGTADSG